MLTLLTAVLTLHVGNAQSHIQAADSLPLKPSRNISFETNEGSWISLDVSPDGRTIVFDLLGDIYTLPIEGGKATRITGGMAFDAQPRFSPDGSKIAFVSDRNGGDNVWIADRDGSNPRVITRGKDELYVSPEWTPDGRYITVGKRLTSQAPQFGFKLWLYDVRGGTGVPLPPGASNLYLMGAAFGPDSRHLFAARRAGDAVVQIDQLDFPWQIGRYDRETGKVVDLTEEQGGGIRPVVSPDGRWLVYATRHDGRTGFRLQDVETGDVRWLAYPVQRDEQESIPSRDFMPGSAFTPDSRSLIASYSGKLWKISVPAGTATEIPFSADVDLQLGPLARFEHRVPDGSVVARQIRGARLSPDGRRLVFTAFDRLWVAEAGIDAAPRRPAPAPVRLTADTIGEFAPAWSPDGRWVAYVTWTPAGGQVYRVRADGKGGPERLTSDPAYYDRPAWSPDGSRLVVVKGGREARLTERYGLMRVLAWLPSSGGATQTIIALGAGGTGWSRHGAISLEPGPHFTRDSARVYIYDRDDGLLSVRFDGTDRKAHLKATGYQIPAARAPFPATDMIMGPDGRTVLVAAQNHIYAVSVPSDDGTPPVVSVVNHDGAPVSVKKLDLVGGDFAGWSSDGAAVYWSLGRTFFRYDFPAADSVAHGGQSAGRGFVYSAASQELRVEATRDHPRGTLVLRGARIITMKGDEVIPNGDLVVTDNRITGVGPRGSIPFPGNARVVEVSGATIMPGLVDVHAHMRPAFGVHAPQIWEYLANLAYGVTTTHDPQGETTDILTYSDLVETGALLGPRIFTTGPGVFDSDNPRSLDDARLIVRRYSEYYGTSTIKQYRVGNRQQRQWLVMAANELGVAPTTEGALRFNMNLTEIADGYPSHEHSFSVFPLYRDVVEFVARSGTTYTPTLLVLYGGPFGENYFYETLNVHDDPKLRRFIPHREIDERALRRRWFHEQEHVFQAEARVAADILRAGGRVALGAHGMLQGLGSHWELWALQSGGMSTHDALRVATLFGADALGYAKDLGSLEPGKLADAIVLNADPLEDIRHTKSIRLVMKNGRLYEGDTLTEIWPRRREVGPLWWSDRDPPRSSRSKK